LSSGGRAFEPRRGLLFCLFANPSSLLDGGYPPYRHAQHHASLLVIHTALPVQGRTSSASQSPPYMETTCARCSDAHSWSIRVTRQSRLRQQPARACQDLDDAQTRPKHRHVLTVRTFSTRQCPLLPPRVVLSSMADPLASMNAWGSPLPPQKDDLPPVPINDDEREGLGSSNGTMGPPHLQRDPRTYGVTGPTLIDASSNTASPERNQPAAPFIRVRLGSMDRNKKDLLIRFDLSVSWMSSQLGDA
jgi:hypothetical protein